MEVVEALKFWGIPVAFTGLMIWLLERRIAKMDERRQEHEKAMETYMLFQVKRGDANYGLAVATAMAVKNIKEANCNGAMTAALATAEKVQQESQEFLNSQGVKHIFDR